MFGRSCVCVCVMYLWLSKERDTFCSFQMKNAKTEMHNSRLKEHFFVVVSIVYAKPVMYSICEVCNLYFCLFCFHFVLHLNFSASFLFGPH